MISKKIQNCKIDIAALSEIRFAKSGTIREEMGQTFFWGGKTLTDRSFGS